MLAFQVTVEDVQIVLDRMGLSHDAEKVFDDEISLEADRIENAALMENDLDSQTDAAHDEIEAIIRENRA
jgi:NifB/MoaA-like Fe-S oxidoreductase